jgi:translation initiation factor IF-2
MSLSAGRGIGGEDAGSTGRGYSVPPPRAGAGATPREPEGSGKPGERDRGGDGPGDLHPGSDRTRDPGSGPSVRSGDRSRHGDRPVRHPSGRDVRRAAQYPGERPKRPAGARRDPSRKREGGRSRPRAGREATRIRRGTRMPAGIPSAGPGRDRQGSRRHGGRGSGGDGNVRLRQGETPGGPTPPAGEGAPGAPRKRLRSMAPWAVRQGTAAGNQGRRIPFPEGIPVLHVGEDVNSSREGRSSP